MTTRFKVDEPLDSLFASIHETGHGLYEQGLPAAQSGTVLGLHAGMAVHESQSRLWENQVARSRGFWRNVEPRLRALFPMQTAGLTGEELYLAVNGVEPTLVRVEADEVTYNLHIILRFEMEKKLSPENSRCATCRRRGARRRGRSWGWSRRRIARGAPRCALERRGFWVFPELLFGEFAGRPIVVSGPDVATGTGGGVRARRFFLAPRVVAGGSAHARPPVRRVGTGPARHGRGVVAARVCAVFA